MDKTPKFNSCSICLRIIKQHDFYDTLKKVKCKNLVSVLSKDYDNIISILKEDPYDKLFLDCMGIKDNYVYIDVSKNEKLIGFLLFYRIMKNHSFCIHKDTLRNIYKNNVKNG